MEEPPNPGVVVLYNHSTHLIKGEPQDIVAEQEVITAAQSVADALTETGHRVALAPIYADVESALAPYPPADWVVFNLGEGVQGRLFEEARIVWALEAMGYRFTGSGGEATAFSVSKAKGRERLMAAGVPVPPGRVFRHPCEVTPEAAASLRFPLIVKPVAEHASVGIGPHAVAYTAADLRERVRYIVECYRQSALAEMFVVGRELAVALWGDPPEILPPAEPDFGAFTNPYTRIVSFDAKWEPGTFDYCNMPFLCPTRLSTATTERLAASVLGAWATLGCRGYARIDTRMAEDGTVYVVDANTNPSLAPDAGFFRSARAAGYTYPEMIARILRLALGEQLSYDRISPGNGRCADPRLDGRGWRL